MKRDLEPSEFLRLCRAACMAEHGTVGGVHPLHFRIGSIKGEWWLFDDADRGSLNILGKDVIAQKSDYGGWALTGGSTYWMGDHPTKEQLEELLRERVKLELYDNGS